MLADEPDYLDALIALGNAGYLAAGARNESFNAEAIGYAKKAIQFIGGGKSPDNWAPFKGKDDTLAYLYYTLALMNLKSAPNQAIADVIKAVQFESELKKLPATYYFLAAAYETAEETVYNCLVAAQPDTRQDGTPQEAFPKDLVKRP